MSEPHQLKLDPLKLANKIISYRERYNITQKKLSEMTGISRYTLYKIESCTAKGYPDIASLIALTKGTNLSFEITIKNGKIEVK